MLNLRQVCKRCWRRYQSSSANTKARRLHLKALQTSGPFNILFLGRDEFSVLVLDQLFENSGRYFSTWIMYAILIIMNQEDVWSKIFVATNQDEWIGRRRSQLSVCMCHIYYIRKLCSNASKAPLKLRSQSLGLETHLIPSKSTFKDWKVHSHASHYDHMLKTFSHNP